MSDQPATPPSGRRAQPNLPVRPFQSKAMAMLLLATAFWGLSFPLIKALNLAQHTLLPFASSWFLASLALGVRFGLSAVVVAIFSCPAFFRKVTRLEIMEGLGLGFFGGVGALLQMDALAYTSASTSAFLTACYSVAIPVFVAVQRRRWPSGLVVLCCGLVIVGMAVLTGLDWRTLRLGRGEWETIVASIFFAGQILWLERPLFAKNRTTHVSLVMFVLIALMAFPIAIFTARASGDIAVAMIGSRAILTFMLALTVFCTLFTYTMMNYWQPHVTATEAGLIYCAEPVWTSVFALFLPGLLAAYGGIAYANESLHWRLLLGGALITAANVCIQLRPKSMTPVR